MTKLQQVEQNIASKEVIINQNFNCVSPAGLFSRKNPLATGITFSYYGGLYPDSTGATKTINDGSITLTDSATNYIEFSQSTSTVVSNTSSFTAGNIPIAVCTCSGGIITSYTDSRIAGFIPSGSTGSGGGGGGSTTQVYTEMFELTAKNPTSAQSIQVTIAGGKYPKPGLSVSGANYYTVADFTTTGLFSGEDTYYMLEITASGGAKIIESQASAAFNRTAIRKLLYVARPDSSDATKVGAIIDLRSYNIYILNKTVFKSANYTAGAKSTTLDFSWVKGLQDSDYNYFGASMTNYPPLFAVHVSLRCKTAEKGYAVGDETEYKTGNMLGSALGNAYQYVASTGNVIVSQGSMVYVWNKTNQAYEVPTDSYWDILVRIRLDI